MDTSKPLVSGTAAVVVGTIGGVAAAVSPMIPAPWGTLVMVLGFVAAVVAGVAAPLPKFAAGKPLLQGGALTVAVGAAGLVEQFYTALPPGWPQSLALGAGALLAWLTGRAAPGPTQAPEPVTTLEQAAEVLRKGSQP
jgi:hypothetical protein